MSLSLSLSLPLPSKRDVRPASGDDERGRRREARLSRTASEAEKTIRGEEHSLGEHESESDDG